MINSKIVFVTYQDWFQAVAQTEVESQTKSNHSKNIQRLLKPIIFYLYIKNQARRDKFVYWFAQN